MEQRFLHLGPAPDFTDPRDRRLRRTLEIIPGVAVWLTLLGIPAASFLFPAAAALFIIAFATFWLLNASYFAVFLAHSFFRMRRSVTRVNWRARLQAFDIASTALRPAPRSFRDIVHLVVLPMVREGPEIVGETLEALASVDYSVENLWVVLATEARAGEDARRTAELLRTRFAPRFGKFLVTTHPADLPDEIPGKGSNETYAVREALRLFVDPEGIPYEYVVVSSFDSDTHVLPQYFSCLTYHYLSAEKPTRSSFQPVPLFNNNIWEAPPFSRIAAVGSTAWQLFMQTQPAYQETFSSHSMSLRALVDVGFWNRRLVNEDSLIFWQCYLAFNGDYRVVPLSYPVWMDANAAGTLRRTAVSVYRQHRRWAYGVTEKFSFAVFGFLRGVSVPLHRRIRWSLRIFTGAWMWACASPLLLTLGWLPVVFGGEEFRQSVLAFNVPLWTRTIMTAASVGLLVNGALAFLLLPPRPSNISRIRYVSMFLQWPLMPLSMLLFGSVPAIEAQTRMMFGKYLGFWVTEKVRGKRSRRTKPEALRLKS